jgi:hypothetical protein
MKEKRSVLLFYDLLHMINALNEEEAGLIIKALIEYEMDGVVSGWKKSSLAYIFEMGKKQLDRGREIFEERYSVTDYE